eukprot:3129022-Pyramimonas_sp.AAC.1
MAAQGGTERHRMRRAPGSARRRRNSSQLRRALPTSPESMRLYILRQWRATPPRCNLATETEGTTTIVILAAVSCTPNVNGRVNLAA